jgi:hypothetical protein
MTNSQAFYDEEALEQVKQSSNTIIFTPQCIIDQIKPKIGRFEQFQTACSYSTVDIQGS